MCDENDESRGKGEDTPPINPAPELDSYYRLLGDYQLRIVIYVLTWSDQRLHHLSSLAERVARHIDSGPRPSIVEVALRHTHLPLLADKGVIEYDERDDVIVYKGDERLKAFLAPAMEREVYNS